MLTLAPQRFLDLHAGVDDEYRRTSLAMVTALDESIGMLIDELKCQDMWEDTVLVFSSDNGGTLGLHNNFPLRYFLTSGYTSTPSPNT